jgi:LPPG:FO 2-phospho-L-lactate transferase
MSRDVVLVLTGGVGGAKICLGLQRVLPPDSVHIAVNTGDDFEHLGLRICPDLDTTLYTLSGLANPELGWGRRDETWTFMRVSETLGAETWFRLGDGDLALHVERTRRLAAHETLSAIMADVARRFGIVAHIYPMSDDAVSTIVRTPDGDMAFQDYFVRHRCAPTVTGLRFQGAEAARMAPGLIQTLRNPSLRGIVVAPSNPYLSIDPILSVPGLRAALRAAAVPIVAVSPLIGNSAVKGPTAKIMQELGVEPSILSVVEHYRGLLDGVVLDEKDAHLAQRLQVPSKSCNTLMLTLEDRERVARNVLELIGTLAPTVISARTHNELQSP